MRADLDGAQGKLAPTEASSDHETLPSVLRLNPNERYGFDSRLCSQAKEGTDPTSDLRSPSVPGGPPGWLMRCSDTRRALAATSPSTY